MFLQTSSILFFTSPMTNLVFLVFLILSASLFLYYLSMAPLTLFFLILSFIGGVLVLVSFIFVISPDGLEKTGGVFSPDLWGLWGWIMYLKFWEAPFNFWASSNFSGNELLSFFSSHNLLFGGWVGAFFFLIFLLFWLLFFVDSLVRKDQGSMIS